MLRQFSLKLNLLLLTSDITLTLLVLALARWLRLVLSYGVDVQPEYLEFPPVLYPAVAAIWLAVFLTLPVYDARKTFRAIDQLQLTVAAIFWATLIFAGVAYFFFRELSRFLFLYFFILDMTFLVGLRLVLRLTLRLWRGGWPGSRTRLLILGAGQVGRRFGALLQDYAMYGVEVVGYLDDNPGKAEELPEPFLYLGTLDLAGRIVQEQMVDEVIITLPPQAHERLVDTVQQLQARSVTVRVVPDLFDLAFIKTRVEDFEGIPLISLIEPALDPFQQVAKRGFDLVVGGIAVALALPVMAIVALLIKFDSPGPTLYASERVGQNGRIFKMLKFRSMVIDADRRRHEVITYTDDGNLIHKQAGDPRVTRVGSFIRRTSLDELPQLFNVLKGEMSLIGPRPELPWLVDLYEPWQYKRFAVPQGITGWWQVNGRSNKPMHLHVEEDLYYIQNYSLFLDIFILWKTIGAVVKKSGAF
jgi:exopolysaccharide biosynthesis polyprenyl glycosylphosphotransferase